MEVLKDASASAIYGSRAANGVILITSKKGKSTKPTIGLNTFYGTSEWSNKFNLMSPERYLQKSMAIRDASGIAYDPNDPSTFLTLTELDNYNSGRTIDAYDLVSQKGQIFSADLSISGKSEKVNYFVSGSYAQEDGLVLNDNLQRVSFRTNLDIKVAPWLTLGTNSMYSENKQLGVPAEVNRAMRQSPYGTWFRPDGTPTQFTVPEDAGASPNPLRVAFLQENENVRSNLFANFYTIIKIPGVDGLSYRLNLSKNNRWIRDYKLTKQDIYLATNTTEASKRNWKANDWVMENILDYTKRFGRHHAIDVTLLYGSNKFSAESTTASAVQLASDVLGWNSLQTGAVLTNLSDAEETSGVSSMARINYRFRERYLLTLTARRDGSSVFAENNKYATFPSAAVSWIASDEQFVKDLKVFDMLKLRLSYGAVGNQAISPYQSLSLASTVYYVFSDGAPSSLGIYPSNISNTDLKWETTHIANIGLDFSIFKGRLGGTVELYHMKTNDLLVERSIPSMTGYTSVWTNLGQVDNKGIEVTLNSVNIKSKKFEWRTDFVFSRNKNEIKSLYGVDADGDGKEDDDIGNRWFIGEPINVFYDYVYDGIYQKGDNMPTGFLPGFARFKDLNGDGLLNAANDRAIVGEGLPKFRWGLTNTFTYAEFQLSIFINAMHGWLGIFNEMDYNFDSVDPMRPSNMIDADWWTEDNPNAKRPSLVYKRSVLGHNWYVSRDFIRIQDASLAYNLPKGMLTKLKLSNLTVYVSGKNLATFTDWQGTNPETVTSFPIARSFALGMRVAF
jgi:TonB-linked SusC/RagA family outer membrane protein